MIRNLLKIGLFLILIEVGLTVPMAQAGGWAAVILDSLPGEPRAGEEVRIGFTVRQHGLVPTSMAWEGEPISPYLTAESLATGESLQLDARQEGPEGHFVVEIIFPEPGVWRWSIHPEPFGAFPEYFEPLTVLPPVANRSSGLLAGNPTVSWSLVGLSLLLVAGLGLAAQRGTIASSVALTGGALSIVLLLGGLLIWPGITSSAAGTSPATALPPTAKVGRELYTAKGCLACHMYRGISNMVPGPVIGPNLTDYQANPDYLRTWLRDPQALKPETRMPNLNLSEAEIEALVAFLSQETQR